MLNKHQIASYDDFESKIVDIWGGQLKIRTLSVKEQQEFSDFLSTNPNDKDTFIFLITMCCIDEDNKKIFEKDDAEILNNKSTDSVAFLANEILSLSNNKSNSIENLEKNS